MSELGGERLSAPFAPTAIYAIILLALLFVHFKYTSYRRKLTSKSSDHECVACVHHDLEEHSEIFTKQIIPIGDDCLVAVGYGLANTICVRGTDGLVFIDTLETDQAAAEALADIRKYPGYETLPVKGAIYTHFHSDHVGGTAGLIQDMTTSSEECEIWAHYTTRQKLLQFNLTMGPLAYVRAGRQFGMFLQKPDLENCGIGPQLRTGRSNESMSTVLPNRTYGEKEPEKLIGPHFTTSKRINIAGVDLELIHAPGETEDQTVVYLPNQKILCAADNFYESFPNLYAIRGVPTRDTTTWIHSLEMMRSLGADVMAPSHTLPVFGKLEVESRLRNYRDAIAFVRDQTIRLALKGLHPNDIANEIQLPAHMRCLQYLKEFYGTIHWSAKAIFSCYLGWFSGDPSELFELKPSERSAFLVDLGGGSVRCLEVAKESIEAGNVQWGLELATAVLNDPKTSSSCRREAKDIKVMALRVLGSKQVSANARNYYLTSVHETSGQLSIAIPQERREEHIMSAPIDDLLQTLVYRVDPEAAEGQNLALKFHFPDTNREFTLILRNSVMTLATNEDDLEFLFSGLDENMKTTVVTCEEHVWRQIMANPLYLGNALMSGSFVVTSVVEFRRFMNCLDRSI